MLARRSGPGARSCKQSALAFTSAEQARPFRTAGQAPPNLPVFEIPESSTAFAPGDRDHARRQTGVFGNPALLWVGHLDPNKDPLTILRAVRTALAQLPEAHLWCAYATAPLLPQITQALARDPELAARVHLLGQVEHRHVEALCRACDLFVLASHSEGSGYALIEALACGLPPVVSDTPSFRTLTGNGAVGALARPDDAGAFASRIVEQASRPRDATRAAVIDHFARTLSPHALGRRLVEVYRQLASGVPGG